MKKEDLKTRRNEISALDDMLSEIKKLREDIKAIKKIVEPCKHRKLEKLASSLLSSTMPRTYYQQYRCLDCGKIVNIEREYEET